MKVKKGKDERIFLGIAYVLVAVFAVVLTAVYLVLVDPLPKRVRLTEGYSFSDSQKLSLEAYKMAFKSPDTLVQAYGIPFL
ncbi:MAG: hypothetical protein ACLUOI_05355 [Eisenbergiella sp.]